MLGSRPLGRYRRVIAVFTILVAGGTSIGDDNPPGPDAPILTVTAKSLQTFKDQASYLLKLGDRPDLAQQLDAIMSLGVAERAFGVDTKRPLGATFRFEDKTSVARLLVPVADEGQALRLLESLPSKPREIGKGIFSLSPPRPLPEIYFRLGKGWLVAATTVKASKLPSEDPNEDLLTRVGDADLVATLDIQAAPEWAREDIVHRAEQVFAKAINSFGRPPSPLELLGMALLTAQMNYGVDFLRAGDEIRLAYRFDQENGNIALTIDATALDEFRYAEFIKTLDNTQGRLTHLLDEATPFALVVGVPVKGPIKEGLINLDAFLQSDAKHSRQLAEERKDARRQSTLTTWAQIVQIYSDLVQDRMKAGTVDFAFLVDGENGKLEYSSVLETSRGREFATQFSETYDAYFRSRIDEYAPRKATEHREFFVRQHRPIEREIDEYYVDDFATAGSETKLIHVHVCDDGALAIQEQINFLHEVSPRKSDAIVRLHVDVSALCYALGFMNPETIWRLKDMDNRIRTVMARRDLDFKLDASIRGHEGGLRLVIDANKGVLALIGRALTIQLGEAGR
ncbi:hypothetical protein Pan216_31860 [Planctomycetes bacterium Pan216]|uniref:Uncharacterized protein n=1 Tax=Kolteria novifilia TaxID=2527975 RepID=A0A518B5R3_9BACT|nr:hypothetical protein Pan216_31860 [Planctomycetes bacterium Pan216]